jgi:endonuclease/exonuclease/phosphatase family metal-dependent hydrolase
VRVLAWNLFHGRSLPPAGRSLLGEFAERIAGWDWDVALLQEVPPWWPVPLARAARAEQRTALTSRNAFLPLRRALADRWPDLIKSNGGGANAILSRRGIVEHRALRLRARPERRVAQLARLEGGICVANLHASSRVPLAEAELERLWEQALAWAGPEPLVLGGDLNLRSPAAPGCRPPVRVRARAHGRGRAARPPRRLGARSCRALRPSAARREPAPGPGALGRPATVSSEVLASRVLGLALALAGGADTEQPVDRIDGQARAGDASAALEVGFAAHRHDHDAREHHRRREQVADTP